MKKSREYKISIILIILALVMFAVSMVTGLIPGLAYSIDKICMYLGFAFFGFGMMFLSKAKDYNEKDE